jgi:hypothetical protein
MPALGKGCLGGPLSQTARKKCDPGTPACVRIEMSQPSAALPSLQATFSEVSLHPQQVMYVFKPLDENDVMLF